MGKYGTDLEGFGGFEGGVNNDKGSNLVSTNSDGETSLLFGPAALREIQAGVANGDFAIPPDSAGDTITDENPLPYWTWTPTAKITAAIIADATAGSGQVFQVSCAAASNGQTASLTRFIAVASSGDRGMTYVPLFRFGAATGASAVINVRCRYYQQNQTTAVGTEFYKELASGTQTAIPNDLQYATVPSDAAYLKITIEFEGTILANTSILQEVRLINGDSFLFVSETTPSSDGPGQITVSDSPARFRFSKGINTAGASEFQDVVVDDLEVGNDLTTIGYTNSTGSVLGRYDKQGSADTTTITTAGTYYALTNAEITFTPQFIGQRWLLSYTAYASLNTTTIQYCFVRSNVTDTSNVVVDTLGFGRADNFGSSGRGATVAVTKVWVADTTSSRKFKLYGTVQTTNGLTLSLAYTQMTAYPIG